MRQLLLKAKVTKEHTLIAEIPEDISEGVHEIMVTFKEEVSTSSAIFGRFSGYAQDLDSITDEVMKDREQPLRLS